MSNTVRILYTNHRGETRFRRVTPECIYFGTSQYHEGEQWFMEATDEDAPGHYRKTFAMKDIHWWGTT